MRYPFIAILLLPPLMIDSAAIVATWNDGGGDGNWNTATNWSTISVPAYGIGRSGQGDQVTFNVTSAVTPSMNLAGTYYLQSISIGTGGPSGITNITGALFDFQDAGSAPTITMASGASSFSIFAPMILDASITVTQNEVTNALSIVGGITANSTNYSFTKLGAGNLILSGSGTSTFGGDTTVSAGTLSAGSINGLPSNSPITVAGSAFLNLAAFNNTILNLSGTGTVKSDGGTATLTIIDGNGFTFSGSLVNGTGLGLGLTLQDGTLTLGAATNTYTGPTILNNTAILQAGIANAFSSNSAVTLNDSSTLNLASFSNTIGGLAGDPGTGVVTTAAETLTIQNGTVSAATYQGIISGSGNVVIGNGINPYTQTLTNANSYTGNTTIVSSAILALNGSGSIASSLNTIVTGRLDISGVTSTATINNISGAGTITLGSKQLIANINALETFSGNIGGSSGSLSVTGGSPLTLSGNNAYTGATIIASGSTLTAGSTTAFAVVSPFNVDGTLDLNSNSNQVGSLSGSGTVRSSVGAATLTILNGGTVTGTIIDGTGPLAITLSGGTLNLQGGNTYTGTTTINGGTLALVGAGVLSSSTLVVANSLFDISMMIASSQSIVNLTGSGSVNLGNNTLVVVPNANTIFNGTISGAGAFSYTGTTHTMTFGVTGSNYTGATTVTSGTLRAGVANAFSPGSAYTVTGTLDLNGFANSLAGLSGSGTVMTNGGLLTLTAGGTFSGGITGAGGLTLTGGTLNLTGSTLNTYSGATIVSGASTVLAYGNTSAASTSSAVTLQNGATLSNGATFSNTIPSLSGDITTFVTLGSTSTLTITNGGTFSGIVQGPGSLALTTGGQLVLSGGNTFTGTTSVGASTTLKLTGIGNVDDSIGLAVAGVLDITEVNSSVIANNLSGSGSILLGTKELIANITSPETFSGAISGLGGSLTVQGNNTLTLSGSSSYTGATSIISGATLAAGGVNAFAGSSDFTVMGTLSLVTFNNAINSLSGSGTLSLGSGTLTVANGGAFSGTSSGTGGLTLSAGTLSLTGANAYTGATIINGGTLALSGNGVLASTTPVTVNGAFSIDGITANSQTIGTLSGSGNVLLGDDTLIVVATSDASLTGVISGSGGSFNYSPGSSHTLTLGQLNTYTGATIIGANGTLQAGVANAFAPGSAYTVTGTLALNGFANTISTLTGTGAVTLGSGTLTVANGGTYSGSITGTGGVLVTGGTLDLTNAAFANTYFGATVISSGATLQAGAAGALSSNSAHTLLGDSILNVSTGANSIFSLNGTNSASSVTLGGGATLTVTNGGSFAGRITGTGGFGLSGGTLILSSPSLTNSYTGATTLSGGTLLANGTNALPFASDYTMTGSSIVDLNGYNNSIKSLSSAIGVGTVDLNGAILTINGGGSSTYGGLLTNNPPGGLTIASGTTLTLSGTSNNYSGPTTLNGTLNISGNGALSPNTNVTINTGGTLALITPATANTTYSVLNSGTLSTQEPLTITNSYTQTSGGALDIKFNTAGPSTGQILATTVVSLDGSLTVDNTGPSPVSGVYTIIDVSGVGTAIAGTFSGTPILNGFTTVPSVVYTLQDVNLVFGACNNTWNHNGDGFWDVQANWLGGSCIPGINGNANDIANFTNLIPSNIEVTVADGSGTAIPLTLYQLNLNAANTSYTISQETDASVITFNSTGPTPEISVIAGSHAIDTPLVLALNTNLVLTDGVQLALDSNTSLTSVSTQNFNISQSGASTTGSGLLVNSTTLAPYSVSITSASIENFGVFTPINAFTMAAGSGKTVTVTNGSTNAEIGPSAASGSIQLGGAGTTVVINSGVGAFLGATGIDSTMIIGSSGITDITNSGTNANFGPTANGGSVTIQGSGMTTIANNGVHANFGPSGIGGNLTIQGAGNIAVTNSGVGVKFGATGLGSNFTINTGSISNNSGALLAAGSGGTLTISGGSVTNDVLSTVGTSNANLVLSSGSLVTSGDVFAFDYVQTGGTLQLNLTSIPGIYGKVTASGSATVGGTLTVDDLHSSVTLGDVIDLIVAAGGRSGTYSTVNFQNFAPGIIPQILYLSNAVELVTAATVTPNSMGALPELMFTSINEENIMIDREIHYLHERVKKKNKRNNSYKNQKIATLAEEEFSHEGLIAQLDFTSTKFGFTNINREQNDLAKKVSSEGANPSRFYIGPIDTLGTFDSKGNSQQGFDFNSVGLFTGFDYAFDAFGIGAVAQYANTRGSLDHRNDHFHMNQIQGSVYGIWVPSTLSELSVDAIVGYGYDWFQMHRAAGPSQAPVTAKGNPQGMIVDGLLGVEYIFAKDQFQAIPVNFLCTPLLNLQYIWSEVGSYSEHGAGVYDLHVGQQHAQSLKTTLGARFEYVLAYENFIFKPELDLGWQYEFLDHRRKINHTTLNLSQVQSISSSVVGAGRNTLLVGVDFLFTICKAFELEMSYDLQWNNLYLSNTFYLGVGGNF